MTRKINWLLIGFIGICSLFYWLGVPAVPFHPDEATQIFMSNDVNIFFTSCKDLFWTPGIENDIRHNYRLLDPPLTRDLIGITRILFNQKTLTTAWDWSKTWDENVEAGALPESTDLLISRLSVAWIFPLTLYFSYLIGNNLFSKYGGWIILILTTINSLILLHTRRSMAESLLLSLTVISIYFLINHPRWVGLSASAVTLAFNAKYSAFPLLILAIVLIAIEKSHVVVRLKRLIALTTIFIFITFLLNPFLWSAPFDALSAAINERSGLLFAQSSQLAASGGGQAYQNFGDRLIGMIVQTYIAPPAIYDVGNYQAELSVVSSSYLASPIHNLFRGVPLGAFFLIVTLYSTVVMLIKILREKYSAQVRSLTTIILGSILFTTFFLITLNVGFQRYYIPLLPFQIILCAYGLIHIVTQVKLRFFVSKSKQVS